MLSRLCIVGIVCIVLVGCGSRSGVVAPVVQIAPSATIAPTHAVSATHALAYYTEVRPLITQMQDGVARIAVMLPSPDVMSFGMRDQAAAALHEIQEAQRALLAVTPPPNQAALHHDLTAATQYCADAAGQITKTLGDRSATRGILLADADRLFRLCGAQLAEVTPRLGHE